MQLQPIPRAPRVDRPGFQKQYLQKLQPVVLGNFMEQWPAQEKWTLDFFREQYGDLEVPIVTNDFSKAGKNYREADFHIPFRTYLDKIEAGPTDYRIFLFNLLQKQPELNEDYHNPNLMDGWIKSLPFMFFGGQGSKVDLHYDIDLSHVFLSQFHGRKRILLFDQSQSELLYQHPYTVASQVDLSDPDYEQYPALQYVQGYEAILHPGETLFMPSGWWHYIEYLDGGFSMALRARHSLARQVEGYGVIAKHYVVDRGLNRLLGKDWQNYKERVAQRRANRHLTEQTLNPA